LRIGALASSPLLMEVTTFLCTRVTSTVMVPQLSLRVTRSSMRRPRTGANCVPQTSTVLGADASQAEAAKVKVVAKAKAMARAILMVEVDAMVEVGGMTETTDMVILMVVGVAAMTETTEGTEIPTGTVVGAVAAAVVDMTETTDTTVAVVASTTEMTAAEMTAMRLTRKEDEMYLETTSLLWL